MSSSFRIELAKYLVQIVGVAYVLALFRFVHVSKQLLILLRVQLCLFALGFLHLAICGSLDLINDRIDFILMRNRVGLECVNLILGGGDLSISELAYRRVKLGYNTLRN